MLRAAEFEKGGSLSPSLRERIRQAAAVAGKLSSFAGNHPSPSAVPSTSVSALLDRLLGEETAGRAAKLAPAQGVKVDYRSQTGLWSAAVEEALLRDALIEVLRNACEAMPERGSLTVRAQNARIENDPGLLSPGAYVEISVKDTGEGIDPTHMGRIFEPFYSTKPRDRWLGVGLAIAYGIVRGRGGDIRVESRPGKGTQVTIIVPAARG